MLSRLCCLSLVVCMASACDDENTADDCAVSALAEAVDAFPELAPQAIDTWAACAAATEDPIGCAWEAVQTLGLLVGTVRDVWQECRTEGPTDGDAERVERLYRRAGLVP